MSSIAYITDTNIIDYHRLNGSDTMVFWRNSLRQFSRFDSGDLVFFIDRRHRHPFSSEKGLIGYGRCKEIRAMSVKKTWEAYETKTGYRTYLELNQAIKYYQKESNRLPARIQIIELADIVFFQNPVYLSEVGFELSDRLEAFTYIENDKGDISVDILEIAQTLGLDQWHQSQSVHADARSIEKTIHEQITRENLRGIQFELSSAQKRLIKNHTKCVVINSIHYSKNNDTFRIYLPLASIKQFFELMGLKATIQTILKDETVEFILIGSRILDNYHRSLVQAMNVTLG